MTGQSQWHGNIETSTDTLVPVDTLSTELAEEQLCSELQTAVKNESKVRIENNIESHGERYRSTISPEVYIKSKPLPNGNMSHAMDESILIQPEQQRMEILNGNGNRNDSSQLGSTATVPNGNGNGIANISLYRRRRNSFNSKPPGIVDVTNTPNVRSDSISPNAMSSKFALPNASRAFASVQPASIRTISTLSQPITNISMISCPDGLAHALSEQNLRLQQIVHEHKVSEGHFNCMHLSISIYFPFNLK